MKIAIVGAGVMGLSAAWALAADGHAVEVFEQGAVPHPEASSVDDHRLIRHPYGDADAYVHMVDEAYAAWERLWRDLGEVLYVPTGTLAYDAPGGDWAAASRRSLLRLGIAHEILSPAEATRRFPHLRFGDSEVLFAPSGGVLRAGRIVAALADHLTRARSTAVHTDMAVAEVDAARGRLVLADGRVVQADCVVVAAGAWVPRLLPQLAKRVTPSRQVVAYVEPPRQHAEAWRHSPMVLKIGSESGFYAVPPVPGTGLKVGDHRFSLKGDPTAPRVPEPGEAEALLEFCRDGLADFAQYRLREGKVCFYDVEREERFIVEPLGDRGWVLSGFSGHGFKFGAVIGERLAAAVAGRIGPDALAAWAAGRAGP